MKTDNFTWTIPAEVAERWARERVAEQVARYSKNLATDALLYRVQCRRVNEGERLTQTAMLDRATLMSKW